MLGVRGGVGRADPEARAGRGQHVEAFDVLDGLARHHRMRAARVIADHAAERAAAMRGGIGAKGQTVRGRGFFQLIADHARLHDRVTRCGVDRFDRVQILRMIDTDRCVDGLAAHRRARAARQDRHAEFRAQFDGGFEVVDRARNHDADRRLAIVRRLRRIHRARGRIETDLCRGLRAELLTQHQHLVEIRRAGGLGSCHGAGCDRWPVRRFPLRKNST